MLLASQHPHAHRLGSRHLAYLTFGYMVGINHRRCRLSVVLILSGFWFLRMVSYYIGELGLLSWALYAIVFSSYQRTLEGK